MRNLWDVNADAFGSWQLLLTEAYDPQEIEVSIYLQCAVAVATRVPLLRQWNKGAPPGGVGGVLISQWACQSTGFTSGVLGGSILFGKTDSSVVTIAGSPLVATKAIIVMEPGDLLTCTTSGWQAGDTMTGFVLGRPLLAGAEE